jgi:hypothetical protein
MNSHNILFHSLLTAVFAICPQAIVFNDNEVVSQFLKVDIYDRDFPMCIAILSVALLFIDNFWLDFSWHFPVMFTITPIPSWWMVTFCGSNIILVLYLNAVIAVEVNLHTLNKEINKSISGYYDLKWCCTLQWNL